MQIFFSTTTNGALGNATKGIPALNHEQLNWVSVAVYPKAHAFSLEEHLRRDSVDNLKFYGIAKAELVKSIQAFLLRSSPHLPRSDFYLRIDKDWRLFMLRINRSLVLK